MARDTRGGRHTRQAGNLPAYERLLPEAKVTEVGQVGYFLSL